jgi:steroid delta-isomerase-like uncharacterized protein
MSLEENKAIARRFFDAAWNRGDTATMDELVAADSVDHSTVGGTDHEELGAESFKQIVGMFRAGMPDMHLTIEDEVAEGDRVVHRWRLRGTHRGPIMGVPPTGKQLTFTGTTIVRIADGKIAERWANVDELGLLQQLGVVPPPGRPPA